MRKVIVRAPETDRLGLSIPDRVSDLSDDLSCRGSAELPVADGWGPTLGSSTVVPFSNYSDLVQCEAGVDALVPEVDGLYAISGTYTFTGFTSGPSVTPPPNYIYCGVAIVVDGVPAGVLAFAPPFVMFTGTVIARVSAGQTVQMLVLCTDPGTGFTLLSQASMGLVRIAS